MVTEGPCSFRRPSGTGIEVDCVRMSGLPQLNPLQRCNVDASFKSKPLTDMLSAVADACLLAFLRTPGLQFRVFLPSVPLAFMFSPQSRFVSCQLPVRVSLPGLYCGRGVSAVQIQSSSPRGLASCRWLFLCSGSLHALQPCTSRRADGNRPLRDRAHKRFLYPSV